MYYYLITPSAPLVLRSGRPVDANTGHDTVPLPLPSTLAGALRAAYADHRQLNFSTERKEIESWDCAGPVLALITQDNQIMPLFPKPQDVYYTRPEEQFSFHALKPGRLESNEGCDVPKGLLPLFLDENIKSKPAAGPAWWNLAAITAWLGKNSATIEPPAGYDVLPNDTRLHITVNRNTLITEAGMLYQSSGVDFETQRDASKWLFDFTHDSLSKIPPDSEKKQQRRGWQSYRFALIAGFQQEIPNTGLRLGGEGRLSALEIRQADIWPSLAAAFKHQLLEQLKATKRLRLLLVTPALFSQGWRPGWLDDQLSGECPTLPGLKLKLCAAAIDRWQALSGWDIQKKKAKAVRRLVPAGSVYWFEIEAMPPTEELEKLWLNSISDNLEDRKSGFGLVLPGFWT